MNKYSVFAAAVILVIICISVFDLDPNNDVEIVGFADDISSSDSGYVFYIIDSNGMRIKAFYAEMIDDSLFVFSGNYSDDNSIFFVKTVKKY